MFSLFVPKEIRFVYATSWSRRDRWANAVFDNSCRLMILIILSANNGTRTPSHFVFIAMKAMNTAGDTILTCIFLDSKFHHLRSP